MSSNEIGKVLESSPNSIVVEVKNTSVFETNKKDLQLGKYLEIAEGNLNKVVAVIQNIKSSYIDSDNSLRFLIQTQPIGYIENGSFHRGAAVIPSPTEPATIVEDKTIELIYTSNKD